MKRLLFLTFLLSVVIAQSFDINGNLKVTGAIEFSDGSEQSTSINTIIPAGMIMPYAGMMIPDGWLLCNGINIERTAYESLFNAIGETYGSGDGVSTFTLPDYRGRFLLGLDNMGDSSADITTNENADILGGYDGEESHTLSIDEMPTHNHTETVRTTSNSGSGNNHGGSKIGGTSTVETSNAGGSQPINILPPFITVNYLIKY